MEYFTRQKRELWWYNDKTKLIERQFIFPDDLIKATRQNNITKIPRGIKKKRNWKNRHGFIPPGQRCFYYRFWFKFS